MLSPDRDPIIKDLITHVEDRLNTALGDAIQLCDSEIEILVLMTALALHMTDAVGVILGEEVPEYAALRPDQRFMLTNSFVARNRVGGGYKPENLIELGAASAAVSARVHKLIKKQGATS